MALSKTQRIGSATALAIAIAAPAEGLRQYAYRDPVGVLTVCYGETANVDPKKFYSIDECKALLTSGMRQAIERVEACHHGLPVPVLAAFGDLVYNVGPDSVCNVGKWSIARNLAAGDIAAACRGLPDWNKARVMGVLVPLPGLTNRRGKEMNLCLEGLKEAA